MKLVHAGALNAATTTIRAVLASISIPILLSRLGIGGFGTWAFVSAVAGSAAAVDLGTASSTAVFLSSALDAQEGSAAREAVAHGRAIALSCASVSALLLFLVAPVVAGSFETAGGDGPASITAALRIGAVFLFLRLVMAAWVGTLDGLRAFRDRNLLLIADSTLGIGLLILVSFFSRRRRHYLGGGLPGDSHDQTCR